MQSFSKRIKDLSGKTFKNNTILEFSHNTQRRAYWKAKCLICTSIFVKASNRLVEGESCGCLRKSFFKDLTGHVYNNIEILRLIGQNNYGSFLYEMKCACGRIFTNEGNDIKSGKIKSCGCKWNSRQKLNADPIKSTINTIYADYKIKAKQRQIEFKLSKEIFCLLIKQPCYYCGILNYNSRKTTTGNLIVQYNGIDRIDNLAGYVTDNVVSCCYICNQAKHRLTSQTFKLWLNRIFDFKQTKLFFWDDNGI